MLTEDFEQAQYLSSQVEQARQRAVLAASDAGSSRDGAHAAEQVAREHAKDAERVVQGAEKARDEAQAAADRAEAPTDSMVAELAGNPVSLTRAAVDSATGTMINTAGSNTQMAGDARWLTQNGTDIAVAAEIERTGSEVQVSGDARWVTQDSADTVVSELLSEPGSVTQAAADNTLGQLLETNGTNAKRVLDIRFAEVARFTDSPHYIYVDNVNGNDGNSGSTDSKFRSIQRAFDAISNRKINQTHVVRPVINPGVPYLEDATLSGASGAGVWFQPAGGIPTDQNNEFGLKVRALNFQDNQSRILVEGVEFVDLANAHSSYTANLRGARNGYLSARMLRFPENTLAQARKAIDFDFQIGTLGESYFNGQKVIATIQNGSSVKVYDNNVHGATKSATGLWVMGAQSYVLGNASWLRSNTLVPFLREQAGCVNNEQYMTFDPQVSGYNGMVLANIVVSEAEFTVINRTVHFEVAVTFDVVSNPTNIVSMKLPVASKYGFNMPLGYAGIRDPSFMPGHNLRNGQNELWIYRGDSANWTVGAGRRFHMSGTYQAL